MQINNIKYYLCTISVLIMMIGLLMWRTDGFSSYTYESNRRSTIQDKPVEVSDWKLENSRNEMTSLRLKKAYCWLTLFIPDALLCVAPSVHAIPSYKP